MTRVIEPEIDRLVTHRLPMGDVAETLVDAAMKVRMEL